MSTAHRAQTLLSNEDPPLSEPNLAAGTADYAETWVRRGPHRIYARTTGPAGDNGQDTGPPVVLLHGSLDNLHLYDRVLPYLSPKRQVVTFDFLGWGASDKPSRYPYTATNQSRDLNAVLNQLGLDRMVLVAHDASGPPAIDWALNHPDRVAGLVLLNTYYHRMPHLRRPRAIFLYSTPLLRNLARLVMRLAPSLDRRLYSWQVGKFIRDDEIRAALVPAFYEQFVPARRAFFRLNAGLVGTLSSRQRRVRTARQFTPPVRIVFGASDRYCNIHVARAFHAMFPHSELFLVPTARHYVQVDEPREVARLILSVPSAAPQNGRPADPYRQES